MVYSLSDQSSPFADVQSTLCRRTTTLSSPARSVRNEPRKTYMRAGSGAAPGSAVRIDGTTGD